MSRPAKLLHIFSTFAVGGPQARTAELIRSLGVALEHGLVAADGRIEALEVFDLAMAARPIALPFVKGPGISPANLLRVRRLLRAERPALLLTYNFGALEAALANRLWPFCPHLHFEDGFGPEESGGRQLHRRVWLRRLALAGNTRIVVPSRTLERIAVQCWGFASDRVVYVPNGVDVDRFAARRSDGQAILERRPGELLVGTVGALRAEKNIARLLRAFAELPPDPPTRLVIVGDGAERQRLVSIVNALGLTSRVVFTGQIGQPERILALLDLFALSSDTEQMPVCLLEAMAAGLPVVATDVGDVAAMLPPIQQPFVIDRAREERFAAAMARLLADSTLRRQLGVANRGHVRVHFGRTTMIERYRNLFDECIAAGRDDRSRGQPRHRVAAG